MMQDVTLDYDIPKWLEFGKKSENLENLKGPFSYSIVVTDYMQNRLKDFDRRNQYLSPRDLGRVEY